MIRDFGNRIVSYGDERVVRRRRARSHQLPIAARRLGPTVWPRGVWMSCLSCRTQYRGNPRRGGIGQRHDPGYCAAWRALDAQRDRLG